MTNPGSPGVDHFNNNSFNNDVLAGSANYGAVRTIPSYSIINLNLLTYDVFIILCQQ